MGKKLTEAEFVTLAITRLRQQNFKGIHTVYSGFNEAFKTYFDGANPIETTNRLAQEGKITLHPVKGGVMIYLAGEGPQISRGKLALKKMGLDDKSA